MAVKEVGGFFCSGGGGVEEWKPQPNAIIDQLTAWGLLEPGENAVFIVRGNDLNSSW